MLVDYRWYVANNVTPAYSFGHGLSYTKFSYVNFEITSRVISVTVKNVGMLPGNEVVQLYVNFPEAANTPPLQLKGFKKTAVLKPQEEQLLAFDLNDSDLAIWDVTLQGNSKWKVVAGTYNVFLGASSTDLRLSTSITIV